MAKGFSFEGLFQSITRLVANQEESNGKGLTPLQQANQLEIENSILVLAAEVVRCDGNFTTTTENQIIAYLDRHFGKRSATGRLKAINGHLEIGTTPFIKIACKELVMLTTYPSRVSIVRFLFEVASADDFVNSKETRCIQRLAGYLGIQASEFNTLKTDFVTRHSPYFVLGLQEGATLAQVKTAYRKMILKYHPDKRGPGVSEQEAAQKFNEVQRAFQIITGQ